MPHHLALRERFAVKEKLIRDPKPVSRTDWERLKMMTNEEVEAAALSDQDAQPMTDEEPATLFRPRSLRELCDRLGLSQAAFAERFRVKPAHTAGLGTGAARS